MRLSPQDPQAALPSLSGAPSDGLSAVLSKQVEGVATNTPRTGESLHQSIRIPTALVGSLMDEVGAHGGFSAYVRQLLDDAASLYDLPKNQAERLLTEARRLGMNRRKYIQYALSLHAESLSKSRPETLKKHSK